MLSNFFTWRDYNAEQFKIQICWRSFENSSCTFADLLVMPKGLGLRAKSSNEDHFLMHSFKMSFKYLPSSWYMTAYRVASNF